ncbi:glycosyltransferase family 2 protein [Pseudarthrobacter sp. J1763]|uniref:glycosyltransferase family 2 protein n=1 Tax=Pseudarthrobacter sp. J1763 TaxID=3420445 RepID=UPI003D2A55CA
MVAHNGADYLSETLTALADQKRSVDAVIGVDTGSEDGSLEVLEKALGANRVIDVGSSYRGGFGQAVAAGLAALSPVAASAGDTSQWIWLLHDDAAPAPGALEELLQAVERAPSVTVAGCKQLDWHSRRKLMDVGLSTSRWAERLTLIEADELDQGQYDGRSDTFAVNSAGMLIRRDVWDSLKGFDPALSGTGDDVDFCWRNRLAGNRVVVVPAAIMFHVRHRPDGLGNAAAARRAQVLLRLKHSPWWAVPLHAIGAFLGSVLRLIFSIVVKDPGHGIHQLGATLVALGSPLAVLKGRRQAAKTRKVRRSVIRGLQTPRREVWSHRRSLMEALGADDVVGDGVGTDGLSLEPSGDSDDDFTALATSERGWAGTGLFAAILISLGVAIAGLFGVAGSPVVEGGGLLRVSETLGQVWGNAASWWIGLGAGMPGHGDPFDYVLWFIGVLGFGNTNGALSWLLVLAMPLSAAGAWSLAAALSFHRSPRFVAALIWAAAPVLHIALNQGRIGSLVAHVMLPWLLLGLVRAVGAAHDRRLAANPNAILPAGVPARAGSGGVPSWTAAAAAGLALAIVSAAVPSLLVPAIVVIAICALVLGRRGRTLWWSIGPSIALFLPLAISSVNTPRALLADPGIALPSDPAPLWQQLLGQPVSVDPAASVNAFGTHLGGPWALVAMLIIGVPVVALGAIALFLPGKRMRFVRILWLAAVVILSAAWLGGHVLTGGTDQFLVSPYSGGAVSAAGILLLAAAVVGAERLMGRRRRRTESSEPKKSKLIGLRVVAVAAVLLLLAGPVLSWALWISAARSNGADARAAGTAPLVPQRLIAPATNETLPATATDRGNGPEQTRTLVITDNGDGSFGSALMRGSGTTLDSLSTIASARKILPDDQATKTADDDAADAALRSSVATIMAGDRVDPRAQLEPLAVGFVVLKTDDATGQLTASRIDSVPGLVAVGQTKAGWLWRVSPSAQPPLTDSDTSNRLRLVGKNGATTAVLGSAKTGAETILPDGQEGRLLVLSERADPGWSAWVDGRKLTSTTSDWAQAFTVPAKGGKLEVKYSNPFSPWVEILQVLVLGATLLLAIPLPARRSNAKFSRDEGSLRKAGTNE